MNSTCIVIPVYNHEGAMPGVLAALKPYGLPCLMVNDGSSPECRQVLQGLAQEHSSWVSLITLDENQGKGGAVMAGCREAARRGFSHALQIDADGQHDAADMPQFMAASEADPAAVICGAPLFDEGAPKSRLYGRLASNLWVWINSLSFQVHDALCGFRVYPLAPLLKVLDGARLGKRMDFDPEILVRLSWAGLRIANLPTRVRYPSDGRSHFRLFNDNWLISRMHAKLFFGMLARFPLLLWNKWRVKRAGPTSPKSVLPGA
jgi:glycosyltransferase involved in cell wall biosynthesis